MRENCLTAAGEGIGNFQGCFCLIINNDRDYYTERRVLANKMLNNKMINERINVIVVKAWGALYYIFTLTQHFGIELFDSHTHYSAFSKCPSCPSVERWFVKQECPVSPQKDSVINICQAADRQLYQLVEWAKHIPHFTELPLEDQMVLLKAGWNELLIAAFSHRSVAVKDGIVLATGLVVHRNSAHSAGVGTIFERVLCELVAKMREMKMDKTELGCLRAIVLFNPEVKGLKCAQQIENLREKVYASLEDYCKQNYPDQPGRFAKLLLRLPALRSIGLKCLEHLFFFKLIGDTPIDNFLMSMLEAPIDP
ncbi:UNVERIFIED_CONTAM: Rxra [Trichonephila clavipes]